MSISIVIIGLVIVNIVDRFRWRIPVDVVVIVIVDILIRTIATLRRG